MPKLRHILVRFVAISTNHEAMTVGDIILFSLAILGFGAFLLAWIIHLIAFFYGYVMLIILERKIIKHDIIEFSA